MNDLATLTARPRPLTVDGKTYQVHPFTLDDLGALQAWVDSQQPDPLAIAQERMGDFSSLAVQKHLLSAALELASRPKPRIGSPEADALVSSVEGAKELLFIGIRKGDPTFTREQAARIYPRLGMGGLAQLLRATDVDKVLSDPQPGSTAP